MKKQTNPKPVPEEITNPANNETPAAAASVANASGAMSTARKLMLAALAVHFVSLFLPYQDTDASGDVPILWNTGQIVHLQNITPEQTGFQLKPFAVFIIVGLLIMFGTSLCLSNLKLSDSTEMG